MNGRPVREASEGDLGGLLRLYEQLHGEAAPGSSPALSALWKQILGNENCHLLLCEENGVPVSSCTLLIVPNLTHRQRPYALIENVVTDEGHRRRGFASACLAYAAELAERQGCYKIMLMTGRRDAGTLDFYRRAGFSDGEKTAFVRWL